MARPQRLIPVEKKLVSCCPDCPEFDGDYFRWSYLCNIAKQDIRNPVSEAIVEREGVTLTWKPAYNLKCPREGQIVADWTWAKKVVVHQYPECSQGRHPEFVNKEGTWGAGKGVICLSICRDCEVFENKKEAWKILGFNKQSIFGVVCKWLKRAACKAVAVALNNVGSNPTCPTILA